MSKHVENDYEAFFFNPSHDCMNRNFSLSETESQATLIDVQLFCLIHQYVGVKDVHVPSVMYRGNFIARILPKIISSSLL